MEYLTFMHSDESKTGTKDQWNDFFNFICKSDCFQGGSEIHNKRMIIGPSKKPEVGSGISGYMKFNVENLDELLSIIKLHPTLINGGSIEIIELPKS